MSPHLSPAGWLELAAVCLLIGAGLWLIVARCIDRDPAVARCDLRDWASAIPLTPRPVRRQPQDLPAAVAPDDTCDQLFPAWTPWDLLTPEGIL